MLLVPSELDSVKKELLHVFAHNVMNHLDLRAAAHKAEIETKKKLEQLVRETEQDVVQKSNDKLLEVCLCVCVRGCVCRIFSPVPFTRME